LWAVTVSYQKKLYNIKKHLSTHKTQTKTAHNSLSTELRTRTAIKETTDQNLLGSVV